MINGWKVETRLLQIYVNEQVYPDADRYDFRIFAQYGRRISDVRATANRVKLFLGLGVLGGTALALLAGLATARRAMEPIAELTDAAREIARTRDPAGTIPRPQADDEVAELSTTLESMLHALDDARTETEASLARQRQFVADASHELRTPLTSVLANLELLEETLDGEHREAAASALRSSRRMRRLVADLLLLARADAGREPPRRTVDLSSVVTDAASELEPVAGDHEISISAPAGLEIEGVQDELHRLVLNLMENALRHTDPGTAVEASVERSERAHRARRRGRRARHPARVAGQGLRALLPRPRRPLRLLRAGALDRARGGGEPPRQRHSSSRRSTGAALASSSASRLGSNSGEQPLRQKFTSSSVRPCGRCCEGHVRHHFTAARGVLDR